MHTEKVLKATIVNTLFFKKSKEAQSVNRKGEDEEVDRMRRRRIQQRRGEAVVTHVQRQRWCDRAAAAERKMKGCKRVDEDEMCCSNAENRSTNGSYELQKCQIQTEERGQQEIRTCWRAGVFQQHIKIV